MKKILLISIIACLVNNAIGQTLSEKSIWSAFRNWNESTLSSVKMQLQKTTDAELKDELNYRLTVLPKILYSPTANEKDIYGKGKPSRYKFLSKIGFGKIKAKDFFVLETTKELGEVSLSFDFFVENTGANSHIKIYQYLKNNWTLIRDTSVNRIDLMSKANNNIDLIRLHGVNSSDITLTEFNLHGIWSRYYIVGSIPDNDDLFAIPELLEPVRKK